MTPVALCADCLAQLYPHPARHTVRGYVHANDAICGAHLDLTHKNGELMRAYVAALYRNDHSLRQIIARTGWGKTRVRAALAEYGVHLRPSGRQISEERDGPVAFEGSWRLVKGVWKPVAA